MTAPSASDICSRLTHWAVLATGLLISSSAVGNQAAIKALRRPVICQGTIADGHATVMVGQWFPIKSSILSTEQGELYARVKDLPVPREETKTQDGVKCVFDLRPLGSRVRSETFTLCYFPWFRFITEPIAFEAEDSVADYVAQCIRFLAVREGLPATVEESHDSCVVHCGNGMAVTVEGMESLERIVIAADGATSVLDLAGMRVSVDRRMFPELFAMGREMLATGDRLDKMEVEAAGDLLVLRAVKAEG